MIPLAVLIALVAIPALLLVVLRVNAAFVFLSLCLGDVLVRFVGDDAVSLMLGASTSVNASGSIIKLFLLFGPAALTLLFMIKTVRSKWQYLNVLPAAGVGLLTVLFAVPVLSPGLATNVRALEAWNALESLQTSIVSLSTLVCLIFLWTQRPKNHEKSGKHHKG